MKKKILCCMMVALLVVGAAMPKKAYAFAGVDDAAVAIVLALAAAAGITFATNDGVQDAVQDFLTASNGKYDSTLERLYDAGVTAGGLTCFKIPVSLWSGVKALLEGLFDYFSVDENRQGSVTIVSASAGGTLSYPYVGMTDIADSRISAYFRITDLAHTAPVYVAAARLNPYSPYVNYYFLSSASFSFRYFEPNEKVSNYGWNTVSSVQIGYTVDEVEHFYNQKCITVFNGAVGFPIIANDISDLLVNPFSDFYKNPNFYPVIDWILSGSSVAFEKSIPYGLTYPRDMTAPDVIDNFEQKVKEGAGDTAIAVSVDGVIDSTLPWEAAQEKYLVNVNDLDTPTETVTEVNTWLSKILKAIKALPATIADAVVGSGSLDFSGFKNIGLSSVFPFCIPFDLKNALVGFNVAAADPVWQISFDGTFMSAAGSYTFDMTQFEKLFAIVRFFIYGGFVVSLILITRKIIKG